MTYIIAQKLCKKLDYDFSDQKAKKTEDVKELVSELARRYPRGRLIFDTVGKIRLKLMLSKS